MIIRYDIYDHFFQVGCTTIPGELVAAPDFRGLLNSTFFVKMALVAGAGSAASEYSDPLPSDRPGVHESTTEPSAMMTAFNTQTSSTPVPHPCCCSLLRVELASSIANTDPDSKDPSVIPSVFSVSQVA